MGIYRGVTAEALEAYEKRVCMGACIDRWMSGISRISCRALCLASLASRVPPSHPLFLSLARSLSRSVCRSVEHGGNCLDTTPKHRQ